MQTNLYQYKGDWILFFKVIHQIWRSHTTKKSPIFTQIEHFQTVTPIWVNSLMAKKLCPFFLRSSIKFQGHTDGKINDFNPIWVRLLGLSQIKKSLSFALFFFTFHWCWPKGVEPTNFNSILVSIYIMGRSILALSNVLSQMIIWWIYWILLYMVCSMHNW